MIIQITDNHTKSSSQHPPPSKQTPSLHDSGKDRSGGSFSPHEPSDSHQSEDEPVRVAVVEISVHLCGQLLFVHVLLEDAGSSDHVNLNR